MPTPPSSQFNEDIDNIVQSTGPRAVKVTALLKLLEKAREQKENPPSADEDCPDPDEDCRDIRSPCCNDQLNVVFSTLPVEAKCAKCSKVHLLRDLVD